jgi:hypothetical protein
MLVTDLPIEQAPFPLPDGLEYRSDGVVSVIWDERRNQHVDVSIVNNRLASGAIHEGHWLAALRNLGFDRRN